MNQKTIEKKVANFIFQLFFFLFFFCFLINLIRVFNFFFTDFEESQKMKGSIKKRNLW